MATLSKNELELVIKGTDKFSSIATGVEKSLGSVGKTVGKVADQIKSGLNQASVALAGVGAGLTAFSKQSVSYAQEQVTATMSLQRQIGGTIENASRLSYAMQRLGYDQGTTSMAFSQLAKRIQDTDGPLKDLNIKTADAAGKQRSLNDILFDVADKFTTMPDGAKKTAVAMELFGRGGQQMIKVLNLGSQGLKELEAQADSLGLTLTQNSVGAILEYSRSTKELADTTNSLRLRVGLLTAPAITTLNRVFLDMSTRLMDANTPLGTMVGYIAAFGGPVALATSALLAFMANIFTISGGLGLLTAGLLGVVTAIVGGGGLLFAFGQLIGINFQPLADASGRLFNQLIDSTNKSISGVDKLSKEPGWQRVKTAAENSIGQVAKYMDSVTEALNKGGFKGAVNKISNDLKKIDVNGIVGSWITQLGNFPWEQHADSITQGMLRMLSAFAERTAEFVAQATPSFLKIAVGIIDGFISGLIGYALSNPLDFALLLLSLGFTPVKVVTKLGEVLGKIPLVGPIGEWVINAAKAAADWVTGPIKGFFSGVGNTMIQGIKSGWDNAIGWLRGIIGGGLDGIRLSIMNMFDYIKNFNWGAAIGGAAKGIGNALISLLEGGINGALANLPGSPKVKLPRFARGTDNAPGGLALVGEEGPELVNLPRGSQVKTASQTRQIMSQTGSGAVQQYNTFNVYNQMDYNRAIAELGFKLRIA